MGFTQVTAAVRAKKTARRKYEALFLVDTGAIDCVVPAQELRRIGVAKRGRKTYELADGTPAEYDIGFAELEFMGETVPARIIFGPEDCEPILGVLALESVGIVVDPVSQALKRLPALPLK